MSLADIEEVTEAKEQTAAEPAETMEDYKDLLEASPIGAFVWEID